MVIRSSRRKTGSTGNMETAKPIATPSNVLNMEDSMLTGHNGA